MASNSSYFKEFLLHDQKMLDQEERRRILLNNQKRGRTELLKKFRGLDEHDDHNLDSSLSHRNLSNKYSVKYKKKLMLSEWLTVVPRDFEDNWTVVLCPNGKRNLLVAQNERTTVYSRYGKSISSFLSLLPLGHNEGDATSKSGAVILDVIWDIKTNTYFVLDVLQWKNQTFLGCERQFRYCWLDSKFSELQEDTGIYPHNLTLLPQYSVLDVQELLSKYPVFPDNVPELDGILFYHKEGYYTCGVTPLVTWLKAFMLPDILNIVVADEYIKETPPNYGTLSEYLANAELKKEKRKKQKTRSNMEIEEYEVYVKLEEEEMEEGLES